ncbi:hypothetical protein CLG96_12675 [Sphingomonas oleivorans]|uniref:AB hydrolase-1 domain-containing protein n=1 Tax=Sphingomonas oleivorans TaxID=1735121 RepID=A0A2T5FW47_9SPHN|nr:alpha/beta hydrolase [Sphingomonas oleivorans]PTQ09995.1 hypothetical protein CLG96_12675 [Sphingomonas oleivorans]
MPIFTSSDGAAIVYDDEGHGPPLLCLHGLNAHAGFYAPQRDALVDRFRIIRPDFRGHGRTAASGELTVERLAADVTELVQALDLRDAIGIGWSLGAMVLWHVLLGPAAPAFAGAITIDMGPKVLDEGDWHLGLIDESLRVGEADEDAAARGRRIANAIVAKGLGEERAPLIAQMAAEIATVDLDAVAAINRSLVAQDLRDRLAEIRTPMRIAYGARSQYYAPETSHFLGRALPQARAVAFPRSGHAPQLEEPEAFNRMIIDFAADLPVNAGGQS